MVLWILYWLRNEQVRKTALEMINNGDGVELSVIILVSLVFLIFICVLINGICFYSGNK
jgi:hypothetical protein